MDLSSKLKYLMPIAPLKIVFSVVLVILSFYLLYSGTLFGLILLGAALKLALREGIEISLEGKAYRTIYSVFGITVGKWKLLPEIDYVSVFRTRKKSRARVIAAQADLGFEIFRLNLFYEGNKHIIAYETETKEEAFKVAEHIAMVLNTTTHDAT